MKKFFLFSLLFNIIIFILLASAQTPAYAQTWSCSNGNRSINQDSNWLCDCRSTGAGGDCDGTVCKARGSNSNDAYCNNPYYDATCSDPGDGRDYLTGWFCSGNEIWESYSDGSSARSCSCGSNSGDCGGGTDATSCRYKNPDNKCTQDAECYEPKDVQLWTKSSIPALISGSDKATAILYASSLDGQAHTVSGYFGVDFRTGADPGVGTYFSTASPDTGYKTITIPASGTIDIGAAVGKSFESLIKNNSGVCLTDIQSRAFARPRYTGSYPRIDLLPYETLNITNIGAMIGTLTIKKPDGTRAAGASVTVSPADSNPARGIYTADSLGQVIDIHRLNCSNAHTITASLDNQSGSLYLPARTAESGNDNSTICNGDSRDFTVTLQSCKLNRTDTQCGAGAGDCANHPTAIDYTHTVKVEKFTINGADSNAACKYDCTDLGALAGQCGNGGTSACSCSGWINNTCGGGTCADDQMLQTRTCAGGTNCITSQCVTDSNCAPAPTSAPSACGGDGQAACCDQNQVNMGISPNPVNAGNQISFSINGSQGSTRFNDTWSGGTDCSGGFWNSTKTCNATSAVTNAAWTHTWRNCMPNDGSCDQNGYQTCSKSVPYTINTGIPDPPSAVTASCPVPGTQATINITASAGATYYALRMLDTAIGWCATPSTCPANCSDSGNLLTGTICNDNITTTTYSFTSTKNQTSLAGHTYGGWVHACNSSGCSSGATYTNPSAFTCIVVPPTPKVDTTKLSCITSADASSTNGSRISISWTNTNNNLPVTYIHITDNDGRTYRKDVRGETSTDGTDFLGFNGTTGTLTFKPGTTYTVSSWNNHVNSTPVSIPGTAIPLCSCEGGVGACGSAINSDPDPNSIATCGGTWTHDFMGDEWCSVNVNATRNRCYRCGASIGPWIQTTGDVHSNTRINAPGGP